MKTIASILFTLAAFISTFGGTPMKDVPIPSNMSIIIFSNTGGGTTEGGNVRQNISFSSLTALTLSGGIENDYVRITPSGNTFTAVAKFHKASGSTTFSVTATTAGDTEKGLEGMTATFTFRVLVLGVDFPHLTQSFYEFRVGSKVAVTLPVFFAAQQAQLNIAKVPTAITSQTYGEAQIYTDTEHGNINRTRWVGEPSGISIDPTLDEENYVRGATLTGTAVRPGVYYYAFEISSYDNSGGSDPFPGANGYGIVIINVYDDREALRVMIPYTYVPDDDSFRLIRHDRTDYASARLVGEFTRSGDIWTRQVSELIGEGVSDVWEYLIARDEETGVWYLSGRNYLSDETAPAYSTLASATKTYSGEIPPNTGWTSGVLADGGNHFFVPGYGFFGKKGQRQVEIEGQDPFVGPIYEQEPVVADQYPGWNNPPATRFADGLYLAPCPDGKWRVSADPVAIDGTEVTTQTIKGMAIPYYPPCAAYPIGGVYYRDLAVMLTQLDGSKIAMNANLPHTPGGMELKVGKSVISIPAHYTFLRQLPPPISTETARGESISVDFKTESKSVSFTHAKTSYPYEPESIVYDKHDVTGIANSGFASSLPLSAWTSQNNLVSGIIGSIENPSASISYHYTYDDVSRITNNNGLEGGQEIHDTATLDSITGALARAMIIPASGRNENDSSVKCYASAAVDFSAAATTNTTHQRIVKYTPESEWEILENTTGTGTVGFGVVGGRPFPARLSLSSFAIPGVKTTVVSATYSGTINYGRYQVDRWQDFNGTTSLSHNRTVYSGDDLPPCLISSGLTHFQKTVTEQGGTPTVIDTWYSDPTGSVYESLKLDIGNVDSYPIPALNPPPEEGDPLSQLYGYVNLIMSESYNKTEQTIGE